MSDLIEIEVALIEEECPGVRSFRLVSSTQAPLPQPQPGAHIDVHIPNGIVRQYSICSSSTDRSGYTIALKREPESRGGSSWMHDKVRPGDRLRISPPRNNFSVASEANHALLLAGGIGITPIFSIAQALSDAGRDFRLHYFAQSTAHFAFKSVLSAAPFATRTEFHPGCSPSETTQRLDALLATVEDEADTTVYACGPAPFLEVILARTSSWPKFRVRYERFSNAGAADQSSNDGFHVELAKKGATYWVQADESIVDVLRANGIEVDTACEEGVCGTCITKLLAGEVDHKDLVLSEVEQRDSLTICVSRAKGGKITIDL
ncbi:MAG: PDR/VanB family oxidoreductase [Rhodovibrionaceae bacterium]